MRIGKVEQTFQRLRHFDAVITQIFLQVTGNLRLGAQRGQTVDQTKHLHSQTRVIHCPGQQLVVPLELVAHLREE